MTANGRCVCAACVGLGLGGEGHVGGVGDVDDVDDVAAVDADRIDDCLCGHYPILVVQRAWGAYTFQSISQMIL